MEVQIFCDINSVELSEYVSSKQTANNISDRHAFALISEILSLVCKAWPLGQPFQCPIRLAAWGYSCILQYKPLPQPQCPPGGQMWWQTFLVLRYNYLEGLLSLVLNIILIIFVVVFFLSIVVPSRITAKKDSKRTHKAYCQD